MKSILYVGAALMIGAGIYGFNDYKKTSRGQEFLRLYHEKEKSEVDKPPSGSDHKTESARVESQTDLPAPEVTNQHLTKSDADHPKFRKTTTRRKLNYKQFSRAPLKEEMNIETEKNK